MRKWLVRLSVLLNILVALALLVGWLAGPSFFLDTFIKPTQDRRASQFDVLPINRGDIVFLGDSITEGGMWDELFPDLPVRNRGIGGDTTDGVMARLQQLMVARPAKVFLMIGTNDLAFSNYGPEEIAAKVNGIVDAIRHGSPQTDIYVQSVLPRGAAYRDRVEALNGAIARKIDGKATWIDLYPLFLDSGDGSIRDDFSNDELHLLGEGYLRWREAIGDYVRIADVP